jgi:nicotinamide mononucleotide transporter
VEVFCAWLAAHGTSCLELVAAVFGMLGVALGIRQNVWSWPVGIVNVSLTFVVFYRAGLYSDMGLQVVYFLLCAYGWHQWLHGGEGHTALTVSRTPRNVWTTLTVVGVIFWVALGTFTARMPGAAVPYIDAATTTASLVAQYMTTRKLLENWLVWIIVDTVYVGLFIWRGLYLLAVLYAVYLVLAVFGHVAWKRTLAPAV